MEGCLEWQKIGLAPPAKVTAATDAYLAAEDAIANWLDDDCERGVSLAEKRSALFESWREWSERAAEFAGSAKAFYAALEGRGFVPFKPHLGARMFRGLRLLPEPGLRAAVGKKSQ